MRLPPWPLSSSLPLCARTGRSTHYAAITPPFRASPAPGPRTSAHALYAHTGHDYFGVNLTRIQPIATALQQKVSD